MKVLIKKKKNKIKPTDEVKIEQAVKIKPKDQVHVSY